jgi:glycosyltransferase involved in cell wall biosynthesis
MSKAVIVSHGLHEPWNMGEVVLAKNFSKILSQIYGEIQIYSTIDNVRGSSPEHNKSELKATFFDSKKDLNASMVDYLRRNSRVDVHFINASLASFLNILPVARRTFLYQFAYNVLNDPSTITHSIGALPLTFLEKLQIITTSYSSFTRLGKLFRRHYYYEPAPIELNCFDCFKKEDDCYQLKILYLGHGSYPRFPYDKALKALTKLVVEGYKITLQVYISKLGYAKYREFTVGFQRCVEKTGAKGLVEYSLGNLTECEKYTALSGCDVVLYPALIDAAIDPPLVILEAMAMGKCVIASATQSIPHLLGSDRGIIVNPRNLENDLYSAFKLLAKNPNIAKQYGFNAQGWVLQEHSMHTVFSNLKKLLGD